MKLINSTKIWLKNCFKNDKTSQILWLPVFFASGIIFYFSTANNAYLSNNFASLGKYLQSNALPLGLFFFAVFLIIFNKNQFLQRFKFLIIAQSAFLAGFLWSDFYTSKIAYTPKVEDKIYATAIGKIDDLNSFYNPILKRNAYQIVLKNVQIYKAGALQGDVVVKKEKLLKEKARKHKKYKKAKKKKKKDKIEVEKNINQNKQDKADQIIDSKNNLEKPKKKRGRKRKNLEKTNEENLLPNSSVDSQENISNSKNLEAKENQDKTKDEVIKESQTQPEIKTEQNSQQEQKIEKKPKKKRGRKKKLEQILPDENAQNENNQNDNKNLSDQAKQGQTIQNQEIADQKPEEQISPSLQTEENKEKPKRKRRKKKKEQNIEEQQLSPKNLTVDSTEIKKELEKPEKKIKKPRKKRAKKPKTPKSKEGNKNVLKSYLNVPNYQEIDRQFLSINYQAQNQYWQGVKFKNPPKKIMINVNTALNEAKIGDFIQTRIVLEPPKKPNFPNGYDRNFENYFKGISASGYAASALKILKAKNENSFLADIKILRQKIAKKILDQADESGKKEAGAIAVALLVGSQNFISEPIMNDVRNSGLAHLLSISGLHFTLVAGIFFFLIRFFLSLNQHLTINYDIKKIAAFIAIFAGFFYLLLADMPVAAVRSFIVIALIFIAILLDLKPNAFRSTAFGALIILIFNPSTIFQVSFQLSFAAILGLVVLADFSSKFNLNSSARPIYLKLWFYLASIILSSIVATIATTPFSVYHFNNFISYGFLANLLAIPITSFITMPLGFLSLILMPFGWQNLALTPMEISINWIIEIARFVALMPNSYLIIHAISPSSFALIIIGGLWLFLWQKSWRFLGFLPIIFGIYLGYKTPIPDLLIDGDRKMLAIHSQDKLIFLKPNKSKQTMAWAKKMGLEKIDYIENLSKKEKQDLQVFMGENFYQFSLNKKPILVLTGRNEVAEICQMKIQNQYQLIVNLSRKYKLPECFDRNDKTLDNQDLKGVVKVFYR